MLDIKNNLIKASEEFMLGSTIETLICHTTANLVDKEKKELDTFLMLPNASLQTKTKIKQKI